MATTNQTIARHMRIKPANLVSTNSKGVLDGQVTKHLNMQGANAVSIDLTMHVDLTGSDVLDVILEGSNDESNWYILAFSYLSNAPIEAYFRVQFNIDDGTVMGAQTLPYPGYQIEFKGSCWATVARL